MPFVTLPLTVHEPAAQPLETVASKLTAVPLGSLAPDLKKTLPRPFSTSK